MDEYHKLLKKPNGMNYYNKQRSCDNKIREVEFANIGRLDH